MKLLRLSLCILVVSLVNALGQQAPQVLPSSNIRTPVAETAPSNGVSIQEICAIKDGRETGCQPCLAAEAPACPEGRSTVRFAAKGEIVKFFADIRGELPPGAYIRWNVIGGTILENQDEDQITVSADAQNNYGVVEAVVEIVGMPDEAFNIAAAPAKKKRVVETCPSISIDITEPIAGMIEPGVPFTYKAKVEGVVPNDATFEWSISIGTIIEGQGTLSIKAVLSEKEFEEVDGANLLTTLSAKMSVMGKNCDQIVSDTLMICGPPDAILIDEFSVALAEIDKGRLAAAAVEQRNNPDNRLYIIEYFPSGTSDFDIREKLRVTQTFLVTEEKIPEGKVTVVSAFADEWNTKIYRVPPGRRIPKP